MNRIDLVVLADRAAVVAWAAERNAAYSAARARWRKDHPLGPVEVTEKRRE